MHFSEKKLHEIGEKLEKINIILLGNIKTTNFETLMEKNYENEIAIY